MTCLGERIRQRTAGVTQVTGQFLRSVQVAEGDVVDAVEHRSGHQFHTAARDTPFGFRAFAAGHERVRQHNGSDAGSTGKIGAYTIHRRGQHAPMARRCHRAQHVSSWFWSR